MTPDSSYIIGYRVKVMQAPVTECRIICVCMETVYEIFPWKALW